MKRFALFLRRLIAKIRLFLADVAIDAVHISMSSAIDDGERMHLRRRMRRERARQAAARAAYQATLPVGERITWSEA